MSYWIYHDKVTSAAKLHINTCGACQDGRGMHGHQKLEQNEWYGPFESKHEAFQYAQVQGIIGSLKNFGLCKP